MIGQQALGLQGIENCVQLLGRFGGGSKFRLQLGPAVIPPGQQPQRGNPQRPAGIRHRPAPTWSA